MRRCFIALVFTTALSACSRCNKSPAGADADAATTDAAATTTSYLPARSAPDDSYAPPSMVESVLFSLRPGLNLCYRVASHSNPSLVAKAIFTLTIGGNGRVKDVVLASSETPLGPDLVDCVKGVLAQANFKPTPDGGVVTVSVPISFRPPSGGWKDSGGF
jgi:hypothetical protein